MWANHNELACQRLYTVPRAMVKLAVVIEIDFSGAARGVDGGFPTGTE